MTAFHEVVCSNLTKLKHFKPYGLWRICSVINFRTLESVGFQKLPRHSVIKKTSNNIIQFTYWDVNALWNLIFSSKAWRKEDTLYHLMCTQLYVNLYKMQKVDTPFNAKLLAFSPPLWLIFMPSFPASTLSYATFCNTPFSSAPS